MTANSVTSVSLPLEGHASRMGVAWAVGNRIAVHQTCNREKSGSYFGKLSSNVCEVSWETSLYSPVFRKLVNESWQTFYALQKKAKEEGGVPGTSFLLRFSRQYRSIIKDCQEQLDLAQNSLGDNAQHSELLYKLELIWNLVEILHVEKSNIGLILPQLLQWLSLHFPQADEKARRILEDCPEQPEQHSEYWDAIILFLIQGRKDPCLSLLRLHSAYGGDTFVSLDELIRKMPVFAGNKQSAVEFDFKWNNWHNEVVARLDEGEYAASPQLTRLASLLAGSEQAMDSLVPLCETWYQWLGARLLFQSPEVKAYDLAFHAAKAVEKFGGLATSLDSVIMATMEGDIAQVMHELCTTLDNFWFPAHLLDLLYHAQRLDNIGHHALQLGDEEKNHEGVMQPGPGLREFLLLEYATCLMSHVSLWQVGALYLDHCQTMGKNRLECLLERMPIDTEKKANKVISMAAERGMTTVMTSVCKVMGLKALRKDRTGTAMAWALRSQDVTFTSFLSDRLLHEYCESQTFSSSDLLDHLGQAMVVSDRLTFLAKYREFHKLCETGEFSSAASLLHSLLWSRLAPKYFWVTLLIDVIPFISMGNDSPVFLGSKQTYDVMQCLHELTKCEELPNKQKLLLEAHEPQIRLNLAKNLASALMEEGQEGTNGIE